MLQRDANVASPIDMSRPQWRTVVRPWLRQVVEEWDAHFSGFVEILFSYSRGCLQVRADQTTRPMFPQSRACYNH